MEKKLILVTSPPACGKTYVAKALAKNLKHVVYLDKDTLIVLSKQIFKVAGQPYDRSSAFFQQNIRDYEYDCVLALAMEALDYDDIVLINAPFTQEVRDNAFIADLKAKLAAKGATLAVIWVETSPEVVHQRFDEALCCHLGGIPRGLTFLSGSRLLRMPGLFYAVLCQSAQNFPVFINQYKSIPSTASSCSSGA